MTPNSGSPENLRFEQAESALTATNVACTLLRGESSSAIARLPEAQTALLLGQMIDADEHLFDTLALNEPQGGK